MILTQACINVRMLDEDFFGFGLNLRVIFICVLHLFSFNCYLLLTLCDCSFLCKYFRWHTAHLHVPLRDHQWPIIYSPEYNITLCGIERLQTYDTCKSGNIFALLKGRFLSFNVVIKSIHFQRLAKLASLMICFLCLPQRRAANALCFQAVRESVRAS